VPPGAPVVPIPPVAGRVAFQWAIGYTLGAMNMNFRKKMLTAVLILGAGGVTFGFALWWTLVSAVQGRMVTVPDVVGLPLSQARAKLAAVGLESTVGDRQPVFSDFVKRGAVAVQDPLPGSRVKGARVVRMVLSRGSRREVIPDLTGLSVTDAAEVIRHYQLRLAGVERAFDARPADTVIAQTPAPGSSGIVDNRVKLLVSRGERPDQYVMPDLRFRPLLEVEDVLNRSGMNYVVKTFANQIEDRNTLFVREQYPLPGYRLSADDMITLKVVAREAL